MFASQNRRRRLGLRMHETAPQTWEPVLPTNVILDVIRDSWDSGDPLSCGHEALFHLARHWSEWQSSRIGTFPLEYRDPSGPSDREDSERSGEDSLYWDIEDAINREIANRATDPMKPEIGNAIQDMIVHATSVINRLENLAESLGHSL